MIRVKKIHLGGIVSLDIRRCKEIKGEIVPTKSGISIRPEDLDILIEYLRGANGVPTYFPEGDRQ